MHNQGFVPQLVVRGSTAPMQPHSRRSPSPDPT
jgi:LacI family transcriptional regulator